VVGVTNANQTISVDKPVATMPPRKTSSSELAKTAGKKSKATA
jgi:hypothetical protein